MRIVGPNCMGVVNVPGRLNASYFWDVPLQPGGISFVSQSGAYGGLFFREARERSLGVAKFLSIGNQSDLGFAECLDWLADDAETRVVGLFVEGIRDGRAFVAAARRLARAKPVVALKGGRAEAGRRATGSHTGSLAGTWETYRAAFTTAGVVPVEATDELFDAMVTLEAHAPPPTAGRGPGDPHDLRRAVGRRRRHRGSRGTPCPGAPRGAPPGAAGPPARFRRRWKSRRHDASDGASRLRAERAPGPRGAGGRGRRRDRHRPRPPGIRRRAGRGAGRNREARGRVHRRHARDGSSSPGGRHPARARPRSARCAPTGRSSVTRSSGASRAGPRSPTAACPVRWPRRAAHPRPGAARARRREGAPRGLRGSIPPRAGSSPRSTRPCRRPEGSATLWWSRRRDRTCSTGRRRGVSSWA